MRVVPPRKAKKTLRPRRAMDWSKITIGDIGALATQSVAAARRLLNVEIKQFDVSGAALTPGTAGAVYPLTQIGQGDDYNQRDGLSLRTVAMEIRVTLAVPAGGFTDFVRAVLFVDQENAGATPAVADVLDAAFAQATFNHTNLQRFAVLHDEFVALETTGHAAHSIVLKQPLDNHVRYSAAAAAAASGREGQVYLLLIGTNNAQPCVAAYYARTSFVDN